jgi:hypothetical protein
MDTITDTIKTASPQRESYGYISNSSKQLQLGSVQYFDSHRIRFIYSYEGAQPVQGSVEQIPFGRNGWGIQAKFEWTRRSTIQTFPKKSAGRKRLHLWIHHPGGKEAVEQVISARKEAYRIMEEFSRKYGLVDVQVEREPDFSEWTIENRHLDGLVRPMVDAEPKLCMEKLGLRENHTSHPGKEEFIGRSAKDEVLEFSHLLKGGMGARLDELGVKIDGVNVVLEKVVGVLERVNQKPEEPKAPVREYDGRDYG